MKSLARKATFLGLFKVQTDPNNSVGGASDDDVEWVPLARLTEGDAQHLLRALSAAYRINCAE